MRRQEPGSSCRGGAALGAALVFTLLASSVAWAQPAVNVVGYWLGEAEHNGQVGQFGIEFSEVDDGELKASLSFPDLEAWDVAAAPAKVDGSRITIGPWEIVIQSDGTIAGTLPVFFVPVHGIPVTFRRTEPFEKTTPEAIAAPTAEPVWMRDLGSPIWAGLSVDGGLLFVGDDSGQVSALEPSTGETRWRVMTGGAVRARPAVIGESLLVHSDDGHLYALDPASGEQLWRVHISEVDRIPPGDQRSRYNNYASSVALEGNTLFVGGFDGHLVALDRATGDERWRFVSGDTIAGTPAVADGRVFFGSFDGSVYAVDALSGEELWNYDTGAPVVSSPLVRGGLVVIGSRSYDLLALDAATGEQAWKVYYWFSWVESSATERDGIAYVGASDGQLLHAVELASGDVLWRFDTGGSAWPQPAVTEEAVFIGTLGVADYWPNHHAAFFAVDRRSGEATWQFPQDRPGEAGSWGFAASPALADSLVFVADTSGLVYAFKQ